MPANTTAAYSGNMPADPKPENSKQDKVLSDLNEIVNQKKKAPALSNQKQPIKKKKIVNEGKVKKKVVKKKSSINKKIVKKK